MTRSRRRLPVQHVAIGVALLVVVVACSSAGPTVTPGSTPAPPTVPATAPAPTPVPVPSPVDGSGGGAPGTVIPGGGGGSQPDPGTGVVDPGQPGIAEPPDGMPLPEPEPTIVEPVGGLTGVHPVPASDLTASIDGRSVSVLVAWWSGVEPCSVLAGVEVARDGATITLTVLEGSGGSGDLACIELAMYKATVVDLGELEPGDYAITAFGDPAPLTVTIQG